MSLWERVADLAVHVDGYELETLSFSGEGGFTRMTTVVHLQGASEEGLGEDINYEPQVHDAAATAGAVLPLAGAETKLQPVFVGDVAEAIARAVEGKVEGGRIYEFGGPETRTFRALVAYVLAVTERRRLIVPLPNAIARFQGTVLGLLDKLTLGLVPDELVMTRDQAILLEKDNVVSAAATRDGRTLQGLGITPTAIEAIVPAYLVRFRKTGLRSFWTSSLPVSRELVITQTMSFW